MTRYQQALLDELIAHAKQPAPAPRRDNQRRRITPLVGIASAAVLAIVALVAMLGGDPAYAVVKHHDGTVSITFRQMADPAAATRDLRAAGLRAQVLRGKRPGACASPGAATGPVHLPVPLSHVPRGSVAIFSLPTAGNLRDVLGWITNGSNNDLTFAPPAVPPGVEVLLVEYTNRYGGLMIGFGLVQAPAPTCWADPTVA
jgi:hypothetical protein